MAASKYWPLCVLPLERYSKIGVSYTFNALQPRYFFSPLLCTSTEGNKALVANSCTVEPLTISVAIRPWSYNFKQHSDF